MKIIPVLGALVLFGLILQIILGFAGGAYSSIHIPLGFAGVGFAVLLVATALRSKTATRWSKITMAIFLVLVLSQTYLGYGVMTTDTLHNSHTYTAFTILIVGLAAAGITARRRERDTESKTILGSNQ